MTELFAIRETYNDDFEEGYNAGFDDGFDMAMLMEGDERFIVDLCLDMCNLLRTNGDVSDNYIAELVHNRYKMLMDARKTGISMLFDEVLEDHNEVIGTIKEDNQALS